MIELPELFLTLLGTDYRKEHIKNVFETTLDELNSRSQNNELECGEAAAFWDVTKEFLPQVTLTVEEN